MEDLTGKRVGRLYVESRAPDYISPSGVRASMWNCICDCGNRKIVAGSALKRGATKSCGCYNREKIHERCFEDLSGQKYGKLLVLYQAESKIRSGKKRITWHCKCDCGNEIDVLAVDLKSKHCVSCGCFKKSLGGYNFEDLTGQRFYKLLVKERAENRYKPNGNQITRWTCQCDCGTVLDVDAESLKSGHTKSCGCMLSFGEEMLALELSKRNIKFEKHIIFNDLLSPAGYPLEFDFAIKTIEGDIAALIEFQGAQHYTGNTEFGKLQRTVTDKLKKQYCSTHNIKLFEIRFDENIEQKTTEILNAIHDDTVPSLQETA